MRGSASFDSCGWELEEEQVEVGAGRWCRGGGAPVGCVPVSGRGGERGEEGVDSLAWLARRPKSGRKVQRSARRRSAAPGFDCSADCGARSGGPKGQPPLPSPALSYA